jgi:TRAP-type uncharacterized transport system substrate-binding protein
LVLCTAAIASIGAAALGETAAPEAKHVAAPRPITKSAKHLAARAAHQSARMTVARARRSIRHGGSEPASAEDRAQIGLSERINSNTVAILAGGLGSTELAVAQDLAAALDDGDNLRVLPMVGASGARNIRDVRFMKSVDLAITQTSLLARVRDSNEIGKIDDKLVYVAKLFNEEMHVLVRADSELVSIGSLGEAGSGTQLIARDVLGRLAIRVREANMAAPEAIDRLKAGEIDALVLIGGKPVPALANIPPGLRVLPVPFAKPLREDFLPATLTSADYPALIEPGRQIETLAFGTVLIAENWPKDSERYGKLAKFVASFFERLGVLQAPPRHPKWREVNLAASLPGWTRFAAAEDWLAQHRDIAAGEREDFARFLNERGAQPASVDREQLFREFLHWSDAHVRR